MAKKASLKQLTSQTHTGRPTRTGATKGYSGSINDPNGTRATGLRADPRLTAAKLATISPTPSGPETAWPGGVGSAKWSTVSK